MKWQWKLGTFAGIEVYIHATFLLLIGWVGYSHWIEHENWLEVFKGIGFILALFGSVISATSPSTRLAAWRGSNVCPTSPSRNCGWR